ncbi:uncharacterized protein TRAVEDRAFT_70205 [Trametes versicolor FP-101664 SS1]|uniref:uncharacterized protein n=1 Tax=Trametes versicolor (strain FP-101664) TaxID=717944 RepID=UPI00046242C7|nr:uncharacterized protein TRAVEDRAFT_70205 [Trametes versicolor FP-101664 SS1]EIW61983.1 hypothetical protein TRAVEDRAFT_70205 [Trametes versicolor FP-101664 SS1]
MRRIAAVFASKRSDRSDAASSTAASSNADHSLSAQSQATVKPARARFFRSISRKSKPVDPVVNRLNSSELHPPSSSSSSSGAPTTPDDDRGSLLRVPASKAWLPLPPLPNEHHSSSSSLLHHPELTPHHLSSFHSTPRPRAAPSRQSTLDTEDDSSEESSVALDLSRPPERSTPLAAPAYVLALTSSHLHPPFSPPPLLHVPGCPTYPRSFNSRRTLPYADSLESSMHRVRLQRRLQCGDLTPSEQRSIASFAGRRTVPKERLSLQLDDNAVDVKQITPFSAGLRRWADRPCFEDRMQVLLAEDVPTGNDLVWARVAPATGYGVAALEYSVALEMLAGLYEEEAQPAEEPQGSEPDTLPLDFLRVDTQLSLDLSLPHSQSLMTPSPSSLLEPQSSTTSLSTMAPASAPAAVSSLAPPANPRSVSHNSSHYKAHPSPLRMETSSTPLATALLASPAPSTTSTAVASPRSLPSIASPPASAPAAPLKSALKQGVRFAEGEKEDKEEGLPLGYVQRIKQKREEKARFLQQERERRKHDDERRKHEEEKRRWEEERAAWEREKRAIEDERKKRMYADEIAAARSRRESQRFGPLGAMTGEGLATGQWDRNERGGRSEREVSSTHSRPTYDPSSHPSRQGSDVSVHQVHTPRTASGSVSGSPSSVRPGSVYGSANIPGSSRPPSMYSGSPVASSSQQDIRLRERRISGTGSRRASMVSEAAGSRNSLAIPPMPMQPMWGMGMNGMPMQGMPMGMVMPMPMYGGGAMEMPLLPPSPPFMAQQYGYRPPSQNSNRASQPSPQRSHSSSPTMGGRGLPTSHSSDRVNRMSQAHGSSSSARAPSVPRSESTPGPRRGHQRTSSGEIVQRPSTLRSHSDDKRSTKSAAPSPRPAPVHSSSLPPHPPPSFNPSRQSWALPKTGFENVSRPSQGSRRQTVIS